MIMKIVMQRLSYLQHINFLFLKVKVKVNESKSKCLLVIYEYVKFIKLYDYVI